MSTHIVSLPSQLMKSEYSCHMFELIFLSLSTFCETCSYGFHGKQWKIYMALFHHLLCWNFSSLLFHWMSCWSVFILLKLWNTSATARRKRVHDIEGDYLGVAFYVTQRELGMVEGCFRRIRWLKVCHNICVEFLRRFYLRTAFGFWEIINN